MLVLVLVHVSEREREKRERERERETPTSQALFENTFGTNSTAWKMSAFSLLVSSAKTGQQEDSYHSMAASSSFNFVWHSTLQCPASTSCFNFKDSCTCQLLGQRCGCTFDLHRTKVLDSVYVPGVCCMVLDLMTVIGGFLLCCCCCHSSLFSF